MALIINFEGVRKKPSKLAEKLIGDGFEGVRISDFSNTGIPDLALAKVSD